MSTRFLWILGIFMGVVMTGLILVQTYWINNALKIKEQQFSQLVGRSLYDISKEIERREAVFSIMQEFNSFRSNPQIGSQYFNYQLDASTRIEYDARTGNMDIGQEIIVHNRLNGLRRPALITEDTVIFSFPDQRVIMDSLGKYSPGYQQLNAEHVQEGAPEIQNKLNSKRSLVDQIIEKMMSPEQPVEQRLDIKNLSNLLQNEFKHREIDLNFEYAIIKDNNQIVHSSEGFKPSPETEIYSVKLFPEDIFARPNFLSIYFPGQKNYLFRSVGFMGISSIALTFIIIAVFIITLYTILRQKNLSEMKSDFVNNMTHELKTPISTISLASQMLNDKSIPLKDKNVPNISRIIEDESKRLGYQVEKVLQMTILDQGKITLKEKGIDMNDLVKSVCNNFTIQVEKRGGKLKCLLSSANPVIRADEVHMTNVLSNLLDNAVKYSKEAPEITIGTRNENQYLVIFVEDNGIGISRENHKKVFEKFYRVHTGNVHNVKGFGLGLSYVRKVLELHKGFVDIQSELNKGTRFELFLPLSKDSRNNGEAHKN